MRSTSRAFSVGSSLSVQYTAPWSDCKTSIHGCQPWGDAGRALSRPNTTYGRRCAAFADANSCEVVDSLVRRARRADDSWSAAYRKPRARQSTIDAQAPGAAEGGAEATVCRDGGAATHRQASAGASIDRRSDPRRGRNSGPPISSRATPTRSRRSSSLTSASRSAPRLRLL